MTYTKNQSVVRLKPGDYTDGRIGDIIDLDESQHRVQVSWHSEQGGFKMPKPKKTWVKVSTIKPNVHAS